VVQEHARPNSNDATPCFGVDDGIGYGTAVAVPPIDFCHRQCPTEPDCVLLRPPTRLRVMSRQLHILLHVGQSANPANR
jgi:hypothetical protein